MNIAPTPVMWKRFCKAIDKEELVDHPNYATPKDRRSHRDELNAVISEMTKTMTTGKLVDRLNQAGIPCGPIHTIDQAFADPQVRHLRIAQSVESGALGTVNLVSQPFTLSRTPNRLACSAPEYGEHTDARVNVTVHPTADWIAQQITEAFPWDEAPRSDFGTPDEVIGTHSRPRWPQITPRHALPVD